MLAVEGLTIIQSAQVLGLPYHSVLAYRRRLRHRLGVKTMQEVIELWLRT